MQRFCKGMVIFAHTKIAAVMLGGLMLIWAALALGPEESLFVQSLNRNGVADEWGFILASNGLLLFLGSIFTWRSMRHIGLALGTFTMFALGGVFFEDGLITPVSVSMPWLGLMSLITLMAEVKGKLRGSGT